MKTVMKTFLLMLLFGVGALFISPVLLRVTWLSHAIHPSIVWTLWRYGFYVLVIGLRNQWVSLLAKRYHQDLNTLKAVLPSRLKLIVFFGVVEFFIIQGGLAWLIQRCMAL